MDLFKESFKYYKARSPAPSFDEVIDFDSTCCPSNIVREVQLGKCIFNDIGASRLDLPLGLRPKETWRIYTLATHPGLLIIRNPWFVEGQRYWIARSLRDYSRQPNVNNLSPRQFPSSVLKDWWCEVGNCNDNDEKRRMKAAMRWATLGYHHNWDTKVYSESKHTQFPPDLSEMCYFFATALGFQNFIAQAAIINFYPIGTTLAGHTDHSEYNLDAPLFSFSFGQTAIFLIGGKTKEEKPAAIYLRSGDVLIMSKESRMCYHAVPRVMKEGDLEIWNVKPDVNAAEPQNKKIRIDFDTIVSECNLDTLLFQQISDDDIWMPFKNYMCESRININVRQVLKDETGSSPTVAAEEEPQVSTANAAAAASGTRARTEAEVPTTTNSAAKEEAENIVGASAVANKNALTKVDGDVQTEYITESEPEADSEIEEDVETDGEAVDEHDSEPDVETDDVADSDEPEVVSDDVADGEVDAKAGTAAEANAKAAPATC